MKVFVADIGGTSIKMATMKGNGQVLVEKEMPTNSHLGGRHIVEKVIEEIVQAKDIKAVGISTAGQVDSSAGKILYASDNIPNYTGMRIREAIQAVVNLPVAVENDVNCAAFGEASYGSGKGKKSFLCLTYGTGIGGAMIVDGNLHKGANGIAGEFGHIITHANGLPCTCGGKGCYEQYASTTALLKKARAIDSTITDGRTLFARWRTGNEALSSIIHEWGKEISYGLVSLTHIFNPEMIILGGGIMERETLIPLIQTEVKEQMMPSFRQVELVASALGNRAGMYGAFSLAIQANEKEKRI